MSLYIHKTDQRLRIRSEFIKRNTDAVEELLKELHDIDAIKQIKYRKHAGSVAIIFDASEMSCDDLLQLLESHRWTEGQDHPLFIENAITRGAQTAAKGLATIAITRLLGPAISRILFP